MKMRTMRTAGLVGGLATGALLIAGTAAQAAADVAPESTGDLVMATPEALGGLPVSPDAVTGLAGGVTDKVPGLNAVPVDAIPGLGALVPSDGNEEAKGDKAADPVKSQDDDVKGQDDNEAPAAGDPVSDLLSGLGGGLPVPLPF
jgi:hypothetical protein